jgi:Mrp family chromosome partitioning ATPase
MSKIFRALQAAHAKRLAANNELDKDTAPSSLPSTAENSLLSTRRFHEEAELLGLAQTIAAHLPNPEQNVIQFIGSRLGEGTSTLIREFALMASQHSNKPVLLVDADFTQPSQYRAFSMKTQPPIDYVLKEGKPLTGVITQVENSNLFLATLSSKYQQSLTDRSHFHSSDMWKTAREQFSLILVDSSPVSVTSDGLALCATVNGVVLVLESEKTRSAVAQNVKKQILSREGNLLGIVCTKRKFHIPKFIHKFL